MGGSTPAPHYQALYRACIKEAAAQAATLIQAALARALNDLPGQAMALQDVVDRNLLLEAVLVLQEHQPALAAAYPQALLAEFTHAIADDRSSDLSFAALPLLADDHLQDVEQLVRASQELQEAVAPQLAELEALLAAADGPRAPRHPLRPEVYVRALHRVIRQSPVSAAVRRRWLPQLATTLAPELADGYARLSDWVRGQGVGATPPSAAAPPEPAADRASQLTIRELRELLSADLRPADPSFGSSFAETDFPQTVPAALQALQDMRKVDQMLLQLRQRQAAMPGQVASGAFRAAVREQVRTPAQALGLEVVHLMVENLAADPRLLPPVQAAVRDLEPALLRLALTDPRFFSDSGHPARQLLEQVTQRSLAWSSSVAPGFREFLDGLDQAVEALLDNSAAGAEAFEIALVALRDSWDEARPRSRRLREKAVRALLRAEQRNLLAERIGRQLLERADAADAPREVLAFLTGPWAQVMAQARLADTTGAPDPGHGEWVATTVLWSVQPRLAGRVAARQEELTRRLEEGLASIEYFPIEADRWLALLAELRNLALAAAVGSAAYAEAHGTPLRPDTWLAPREAYDSGFVSGPGSRPVAPPAEPDALPPIELPTGAWVDLLAEEWERWQLTWASPHGLLFMFTHANGATRSMTRHRLQQMLVQGQVRLVSAQAVVDGALDAVAQTAWRNSTRHV